MGEDVPDDPFYREEAILQAAPAETLPAPFTDLELIFQQHQRRIFGAAYRITGSAQDAEDVLQTVFLRLLRRWQQLDLSPSPASYLQRAAVNAALDLMRARARSRAVPLDDLEQPPRDSEQRGPDQQHEDRELRSCLRRAVLDLSPKGAEIFSLRYFEGVSNREIARMLGVSQTAVAVSLHRGRNRVKKTIRAFVGGIDHA